MSGVQGRVSAEKNQTKFSWLNRFSLTGYPMVSSRETVYVSGSTWTRWDRAMAGYWSYRVTCKRMSHASRSQLHAGHEVKSLALQNPNGNRKGVSKINSRNKMRQSEFSPRICTSEGKCGMLRGWVADPLNRILGNPFRGMQWINHWFSLTVILMSKDPSSFDICNLLHVTFNLCGFTKTFPCKFLTERLCQLHCQERLVH